MARKPYMVDEVLKQLYVKNDLRINKEKKEIEILSNFCYIKGVKTENPKRKNDIGNKSWGKISFLINYHGFRAYRVSEFN